MASCQSKTLFIRVSRCAAITVFFTMSAASLSAQEFIGPLEYSSFNLPASGVNVSPFSSLSFSYFHLEDFEDGLLNTPGVTVREFTTTNISTAYSDSVDGDDGVIDGVATGNASSLFSNLQTPSFTFDFNPGILGDYPTHAGVVWTDIGRNNGGTPFSSDLVDNTYFEAFDMTGASIGLIGPVSLGDANINRTTDEDRFFGVVYSGGISAVSIFMPGKNNWEIDHLQYGRVSSLLCNNLVVTVDLNLGQTPGPGDDVVLGTPGNDDIRGKAGNDTICGMGGDDFIHGNSGNDWIDGGNGVDNIRGGQGSDTLFSGSGATVGTGSRVFGGNGDDFIFGGPDKDDLRGGRGDDMIFGEQGADLISGNADDDTIFGGPGADTISGGSGENDELYGEGGGDSLNGGLGSSDFCDGGGQGGDSDSNCEIF